MTRKARPYRLLSMPDAYGWCLISYGHQTYMHNKRYGYLIPVKKMRKATKRRARK